MCCSFSLPVYQCAQSSQGDNGIFGLIAAGRVQPNAHLPAGDSPPLREAELSRYLTRAPDSAFWDKSKPAHFALSPAMWSHWAQSDPFLDPVSATMLGGPSGARWFVLAIVRMIHVCRRAENSLTFLQNTPHPLKLAEVVPYMEASLDTFCRRMIESAEKLKTLMPSRLPPRTVEITGLPPDSAAQPLTVTHGRVMALTSLVRAPRRRQSAPVLALFDTTVDVSDLGGDTILVLTRILQARSPVPSPPGSVSIPSRNVLGGC
jgi:hypothetical protein